MKYVIAFIAGTLAGAVIALLFAPASGEEMRLQLGERASAEQERAAAEYHRRMEDMQALMGKMQTDMQAMINRSQEEGDMIDAEAIPEGYMVSD